MKTPLSALGIQNGCRIMLIGKKVNCSFYRKTSEPNSSGLLCFCFCLESQIGDPDSAFMKELSLNKYSLFLFSGVTSFAVLIPSSSYGLGLSLWELGVVMLPQ